MSSQFRFIFYSDTHLGFEYPFAIRSNHNYRGEDFFTNFHRVYAHALESDINLVIHGGDVFYRSRIPQKLINLVYTMFLEYAARGIQTYIVPGNHERSLLPVSLFLNHPLIKIFSKPKTFTERVNGILLSISGFPFIRHNIRSEFSRKLIETRWREAGADYQILCLHQAIEGAKVGPNNYTFRNRDDVIRIEDFPGQLDGIFCGHIHRRQILTTPSGIPVIHSGSTEKTSFAEEGEKKGFYEISLSMDRKNVQYKFIELPSRPMIQLNMSDIVSHQELIDRVEKKVALMPSDAIIRINSSISISIKELRKYVPETMTVYFRLKTNLSY